MKDTSVLYAPSCELGDLENVLYFHELELDDGRQLRVASRNPEIDLSSLGKVAVVSGAFNLSHEGHIACRNEASKYGPVVAIVNGDRYIQEKYADEPTMTAVEALRTRMAKVADSWSVAMVVESIDADQTVCATIDALARVEGLTVGWFANGGDRKQGNVPEEEVCTTHGIEMLWGCGGDFKMNNSSFMVRKAAAHAVANTIDEFKETRWGGYCNMSDSGDKLVKTLKFKSGKGVSLQTHERRSEEWLCTEGYGLLYLGQLNEAGEQIFDEQGVPLLGEVVRLEPGTKVAIAKGQAHMNLNDNGEPHLVHETWKMDPDDPSNEDDIKKFGDPFSAEDPKVREADRKRLAHWLAATPASEAIAAE